HCPAARRADPRARHPSAAESGGTAGDEGLGGGSGSGGISARSAPELARGHRCAGHGQARQEGHWKPGGRRLRPPGSGGPRRGDRTRGVRRAAAAAQSRGPGRACPMETHRRWDAERGAVHVLARLSGHVLEARHEEDLLRAMAGTLREYTGVDAVLIRLLERQIETRAVATAAGVQVLAPGDLAAPFTLEDEAFWRAHPDGYFCPDMETSAAIKPEFRQSVLDLGLRAGYMVPATRDGELCGQIIFAWKSVPPLTDAYRAVLGGLARFACLPLAFFHWGKGGELDPMTGR